MRRRRQTSWPSCDSCEERSERKPDGARIIEQLGRFSCRRANRYGTPMPPRAGQEGERLRPSARSARESNSRATVPAGSLRWEALWKRTERADCSPRRRTSEPGGRSWERLDTDTDPDTDEFSPTPQRQVHRVFGDVACTHLFGPAIFARGHSIYRALRRGRGRYHYRYRYRFSPLRRAPLAPEPSSRVDRAGDVERDGL